jgi:hypothetical protein
MFNLIYFALQIYIKWFSPSKPPNKTIAAKRAHKKLNINRIESLLKKVHQQSELSFLRFLFN